MFSTPVKKMQSGPGNNPGSLLLCLLLLLVAPTAGLQAVPLTPQLEQAESPFPGAPPVLQPLAVADASDAIKPALPQAESIDLDEPVPPVDDIPVTESVPATTPPAVEPTQPGSEEQEDAPAALPLILLGTEVAPGTATRLSWTPSHSFEGIASPIPILVVHGAEPGPVLCLTAAIHGDELNGIEIVRRVLYNLEAEKLSGTVIGVPIVNLQGFHRASRYLADRRDLNRYFPGNPEGSSASRIAYSFFYQVIAHCNALVDLHTGSFYRTNLPQLRADLSHAGVVQLTQGFGATVVLHHDGARGTLRRAATDAGIPAVTLETGAPMQLQEEAVSHGVKGIQTLLNKMGMNKKVRFWGNSEPVYYQSTWVRANLGGILFSNVKLGQTVKDGQTLGTVTDPITNVAQDIVSPYKGRILGMALNQVVQPGFAAYRIGIQADEKEIPAEEEEPVTTPEPTPEDEPDLAQFDERNPDEIGLEDSE